MADNDVAVIGGGISGIGFAHYCSRHGLSTVLLEGASGVGGVLQSMQVGSGFWLEFGAHTCYNSYGNLIGMLETAGLEDHIVARRSVPFKMLTDRGLRSVASLLNYLELLGAPFRALRVDKTSDTVAEYYGGLAGAGNYHRVVRHFLNAVPSQEADRFPADMLFKARARRKDVLRSFTLRGGMETVMLALAEESGADIRTGCHVDAVRAVDGGFAIETARGQVRAAKLVFATPAWITAELVRALDADTASVLSTIKPARVNSRAVIVKKNAVAVEPVAGIVAADDLFFSAVSRDTVDDDEYRGFTFHFKPEVTDERLHWDRIEAVLGVTKNAVVDTSLRGNALPALRQGHRELIARLEARLRGSGVYMTGNYFGGLALEDCVSRSRDEFERLTAELSR